MSLIRACNGLTLSHPLIFLFHNFVLFQKNQKKRMEAFVKMERHEWDKQRFWARFWIVLQTPRFYVLNIKQTSEFDEWLFCEVLSRCTCRHATLLSHMHKLGRSITWHFRNHRECKCWLIMFPVNMRLTQIAFPDTTAI